MEEARLKTTIGSYLTDCLISLWHAGSISVLLRVSLIIAHVVWIKIDNQNDMYTDLHYVTKLHSMCNTKNKRAIHGVADLICSAQCRSIWPRSYIDLWPRSYITTHKYYLKIKSQYSLHILWCYDFCNILTNRKRLKTILGYLTFDLWPWRHRSRRHKFISPGTFPPCMNLIRLMVLEDFFFIIIHTHTRTHVHSHISSHFWCGVEHNISSPYILDEDDITFFLMHVIST